MRDIKEILNQMNEFMELNEGYSISTRKKYLNIIRLFLLEVGMKFKIEDINAFISKRNSKSNCYIYKFAFKSFLTSIGKKKWYVELRSVKRKPRKKLFKYITKDIVNQMINLLPSKFRYMALIQLKTGCRFIEVATMRAENIEFDSHPSLIYIKLGIGFSKTKGNKARLVRIHKKYEVLIRKLCIKPFGYVFLDKQYEKEEKLYNDLDNLKRYYNRELQKVGERFDIKGFSSHYLRHLFADEFMMHKGTIESLKIIMGHSRMDTTMDYISVGDKFADKVIEEMG